jgi:hypothetical protein
MWKPGRRRVALSAALLAALIGAQPLTAQDTPPPAEEVIERYLAAIGGRDLLLRRTSSHTTGRVEVPAAGMTGAIEVLVAGPRAATMRATIEGFGEQQMGILGDVAWSIDPMAGPRLLEGGEKDTMVETADPTVAARDAHHFSTRESIGFAEYDGERCVEVRYVFHSGRETVDCYSLESGLLIGNRTQRQTAMGSMPVTTRLTEYREFGGMRLPTRLVQQVAGIEQITTIEAVHYDVVEESAIRMPPQIRALVDR